MDIKDLKVNNGLLTIKLRGEKNTSDISYIFSECESLVYKKYLSNLNDMSITNMTVTFSQCTSLISLPDISNFNTENVIKMNNLFSQCSSLE